MLSLLHQPVEDLCALAAFGMLAKPAVLYISQFDVFVHDVCPFPQVLHFVEAALRSLAALGRNWLLNRDIIVLRGALYEDFLLLLQLLGRVNEVHDIKHFVLAARFLYKLHDLLPHARKVGYLKNRWSLVEVLLQKREHYHLKVWITILV